MKNNPETTSSIRQLVAILFADIAGYSKLMQENEKTASSILRKFQYTIENNVPSEGGEIRNFYGDGVLITYSNPLNAIQSAIELQSLFREDPSVPVRIGIHLGTVVEENKKIFGDSVNIASRIESMGVPGSILISKTVYDEISNQPNISALSLGNFAFKNIKDKIEVFVISNEGLIVPKKKELVGKFKKTSLLSKYSIPGFLSIAILIFLLFYYNTISVKDNDGTQIENKEIGSSIAVLPFINLTSNEEQEYFSMGISEQILHNLAQIDNLKVAGRTSSFSFKNKELTIQEIGKQLNVENILEGSVQKVGNEVKITAQLINVKEDSHFWSKQYQRNLTDIFALQNEIADDIAREFRLTLERGARSPKKINPEAYDWFLKGNEAQFSNAPESDSSINCYHKALEIEPNYSPIYSQMAYSYLIRFLDGSALNEASAQTGLLAAQIAYYHDPTNIEAKCLINILRFYITWNWNWIFELNELDISKLPLTIKDEIAFFNSWNGFHETGLLQGENIIKEDPLDITHQRFQASRFDLARQYEKILTITEKIEHNHPLLYNIESGKAFMGMKSYENAIKYLENAFRLGNNSPSLQTYLLTLIACCHYYNNNWPIAENTLLKLEEMNANYYIPTSYYAMINTAKGDFDQAFNLLDLSIQNKESWLFTLKELHLWDPLREDERFEQYIKQIFDQNPVQVK